MGPTRRRCVAWPWGELLEGADDGLLIEAVTEHLRAAHLHLSYDREQILIMAY